MAKIYYYKEAGLQFVNFPGFKMTNNKGPILYEKFLENLRREIKESDYNYKSLGKIFNRGGSWLSLKMSGNRELPVKLLFEIAEILNINPASLIPGQNPEPRLNLDEYIKQIGREDRKPDIDEIKSNIGKIRDDIREIKETLKKK